MQGGKGLNVDLKMGGGGEGKQKKGGWEVKKKNHGKPVVEVAFPRGKKS